MQFVVTKSVPLDAKNLRIEIFVEEQGFLEEFDEIDDYASHIVMYLDKKPVATGRIFIKEDKAYKIGRVAVKKEHRGQGLGTKVMQKLEEIAKDEKAEIIMLSSQYHAKKFYENCGYKVDGEPYLEDGAKHILMKKNIN